MARKTDIVTIEADNRDKGKRFLITEAPPLQAEKWANRAILAMGRVGIDVPPDLIGAGWPGIVAFGYRALGALQWADAEPLLDELWTCVQALPESNVPRKLVDSDTEEIGTIFQLRLAAFELHAGFSIAALLSTSSGAAKGEVGTSQNMSTSREA